MMDSNFHPGTLRLRDLIDDLVTEHGGLNVARVLLATLFARVRRRPRDGALSNHMRRDVGLPPHDPPPAFRDLMM